MACLAASRFDTRIRTLSGSDRATVISAYKAADLFVLASRIECSPVVLCETMAAGIPFVALDVGDVKSKSRFGVVVDDQKRLAGAIERMLDDPVRREELGATAREEWAKTYTWDAITNRFEDLYERVAR